MEFLCLFLLILCQIPILLSTERSTYIVHMNKSSMPKPFTHTTHWYSAILNSLASSTSGNNHQYPSNLLYTYDNALHGFSAVLSKGEVDMLKQSPGVLSLYRDDVGSFQTTYTPEFLSLNHAYGLWPASQYGENVIIGVVDTGIWPESRSYNDNGMEDVPARWKGMCQEGPDFNASLCNKKLIGVRYFNEGWNVALPNYKWFSGRDTEGHGTHTSSTAAGNYVEGASFFGYATGTARGIAPRAHVAMYKVSPTIKRIYASDALAGIDQAIADGVDVLSLSLGFPTTLLYENPISIASFAAMEKGIFVSCAAGNDGLTVRVSNGFPWALTVAASSIDRLFSGTLILGNNLSIKGWTTFPGQPIIKNVPLLYDQTISFCDSIVALPTGFRSVIICQNSRVRVSDQLDNVGGSHAAAAIIISNEDHDEVIENTYFKFPGVVISSKSGLVLIDYVTKSVNPVVSIEFQQTFLGEKQAPAVAKYSSRGPSPSYPDILKPDVMAPGSLVLASWIPYKVTAYVGQNITLTSEFSMDYGTSMACPHAAGIAALLKGAHPDWSSAAIRSAIMTTASTFDNTGDYIRDDGLNEEVATPLAMGSGQVNPNAALDPGLIYDITPQDYVNLLCSMGLTESQIRCITRSPYVCFDPSSDLNYPSFIAFYINGTIGEYVRTFRRTVKNVGDRAALYTVEVMAPQGSLVDVYPKTMLFREKFEKQDYTVTLSYPGDMLGKVSFGSLTWVDDARNYVVRSPIVVSPTI